jgi:membrane protein
LIETPGTGADMPAWWVPVQETASQWSEHKDARLGAALAYYSIFSLGPLIVIAIAIAGLAFGAEAVQAQVFGALHGLLGDSGTQAIEAMLKGANRPREGIIPTVIGVGTLVFAAVGVVCGGANWSRGVSLTANVVAPR